MNSSRERTAGQPEAAPLVPVASVDTDELDTCSLVLSAVGIAHHIDLHHNRLLVAATDAPAAEQELRIFFEENRNWPSRPAQAPPVGAAADPPTLLAMGSLAVFYLLTGPWTDHNPWFTLGAIDSRAILDHHQWWRLVTALTLHADLVHLAGNCIIGGFMVHLLCRILGHGSGWLLLLGTGAAGNFLNIILRGQEHHSVGFSTAVFAAIGCFSSLQAAAGRHAMLRQILLSLGAGAALLAMLGTGGERTDLGAHLFGFLSGLVAGILARLLGLPGLASGRSLQGLLFLLAQIVVAGCWLLAWRSQPVP